MNPTLHTIGLFALMTLILMGIGALFFYLYSPNAIVWLGFYFAFIVLINMVVYFTGHRMVLWRYGVRMVDEKEEPVLHAMVAEVAEKMGIPKPGVGIMPSRTPNAFATGRNRNNSVVVFTTGILQLLKPEEIKGVISHELAHIRDRDVLLVTIAAVLASSTAFLARIFLWRSMFRKRDQNALTMLVMVLAAMGAAFAMILIRFAISRQREFKADEMGARAIGDPRPLENALMKLENGNERWPLRTGNPASSSMFIVNPFRGSFTSLLSTHPPTAERIRRLQELEPELLHYDMDTARESVYSAPYKIK